MSDDGYDYPIEEMRKVARENLPDISETIYDATNQLQAVHRYTGAAFHSKESTVLGVPNPRGPAPSFAEVQEKWSTALREFTNTSLTSMTRIGGAATELKRQADAYDEDDVEVSNALRKITERFDPK
ncbi:hypothetical protein [Natronoglycomyces albus]|uniref:Uncharacterized protein n=1 Tax=Natronoglycomyces albus TaxID=2811108 RepID=A0A895XRQ1_9ACTN|nr:hypothetical protein [Natronoglycomyces albus]QSB04930.1 hypothetical protein JQS30_14365 [Natronoglycomyces albus]